MTIGRDGLIEIVVQQIRQIRALEQDGEALEEHLSQALGERDAYRLVATQALHHAHDLHVENTRKDEQLHRLRAEFRDMRDRQRLGRAA
jgi:hypothetical protein